MPSSGPIMIQPNAPSIGFFGNHLSGQKQLRLNSTLQNDQDIGVKFDLQLLLERQSLNETWNKLVKNGLLTLDQMNLCLDGINNKTIGSPSGNFPCACCDGECDLKCQIASQSPTSSTHLERPLARFLNSWTWNKDAGGLHYKKFIRTSKQLVNKLLLF